MLINDCIHNIFHSVPHWRPPDVFPDFCYLLLDGDSLVYQVGINDTFKLLVWCQGPSAHSTFRIISKGDTCTGWWQWPSNGSREFNQGTHFADGNLDTTDSSKLSHEKRCLCMYRHVFHFLALLLGIVCFEFANYIPGCLSGDFFFSCLFLFNIIGCQLCQLL